VTDTKPILIRVGDEHEREVILAEVLGENRARLIAIPIRQQWLGIFDVVQYEPASAQAEGNGTSYALVTVHQHSGYRAYPAWGVMHRPRDYDSWVTEVENGGVVIQEGHWATGSVRQLWVAVPPQMSILSALIRFNRAARTVEIIAPTLAADADDLDRAKSDLERAVAWGGSDSELTYALAMTWERQERIDEAITFWERLSHLLPDDISVRERLAANYARLGVFPHAALEFDRAATLAEDSDVRLRLEAARDLMWQKSKT
jgi:tetratricopeptide (TPR) repeat protein